MRSAIAWIYRRLWLLPHITALAALTLLTLRLASNLRFLRLVERRARAPLPAPPRVSVLVPARDEAASLAACLNSLLAQRYPNLELIALDDSSTDGTGALLDSLAERNPALIALHSSGDPPPGWNGKSRACDQLAARASGEWLLFTDADTLHEPESVVRGMRLALGLDAALLSVFPRQRVQTWSERVLVSFIIDFLPLVGADFRALWRARPTRPAANGQYLLARADAYHAIGGHASVASALVDDFALASRFHACGYRVALAPGQGMVSCRMYHNTREVWGGFSKNLLAALTTTPPGWAALWQTPLFAWSYACVCALPFVNLARARARLPALVEIGWLLALRALVIWRLRRPLDEIVTTPLAAWGVMLLGLAALARRARGRGVVWKG